MTIGIDGNEANVNQRVGVSVYTQMLLSRFHKVAYSKLVFNIFLKEKVLPHLPKPNEYFKYITVQPKILWSQVALPLYLTTHKKPDVFFSPAHYAPRFNAITTVVTVHDLSYLYYPNEFLKSDLFKLKNWTEYSIYQAKKIIAVSENTKKDLIKFYRLPDSKIKVIYNGYEKQARDSKLETRSSSLKLNARGYILYIGTLQPRKNISLLISAFAKFRRVHPEFKLVIVGKKGWLYDKIFEQVRKLNLQNEIIFTGYVSDEELINLYKNAFCFVLPSLYEGFGIPILEAMSFDCPVVSSSSSSLPEIGGNACLYFDPKSEKQLLEKLESLVKNGKLRDDLIRKARERIKLFSWQKCADQTLEVLKSVAK